MLRSETQLAQIASHRLNLVCGSGGSRAILGSAGTILACHLAGIDKWNSIGGASGGSIPSVMLAGGQHPAKIVRFSIDIDFSSLLTRRASLAGLLVAYVMKGRYEKTRPLKGVLGSEKVGDFIESYVPEWPDNYWTVAVAGNEQILFTADGVFAYGDNGRGCMRVLSDQPAPVGLAIRASCAVPGIIDAVHYRDLWLFDGALSVDGRCPAGIVTRHFGQQPESIVACDVGEDGSKTTKRLEGIWKAVCGSGCISQEPDPDLTQTILIAPHVNTFRSLQFKLSADQKFEAVMAGLLTGVAVLEEAGLLTGERLKKAQCIVKGFEAIQGLDLGTEGELATKLQALLTGHDLYLP